MHSVVHLSVSPTSASADSVDDKTTTWEQIVSLDSDRELQVASYGLERRADGLLYWNSRSPVHPRNWSTPRKVFDTSVIIAFEFYTTVISTTGASIADTAGPEYGLGRMHALFAFTFMYQLGQAIGGCLIPPFSEVIGRRLPYLVSCAAFSIFSVLIPLTGTSSSAGIYIGRFVTGFASAVPSVVIAGSVEDIFNAERRVWIVVLWNVGTTIGLCFGPIYAAYLTAAVGWNWVFYSAGIATAVLFVALLFIRESRPSMLLGKQVARMRRETNLTELRWHNPDSSPDLRSLLELVVIRPARLLFTEPLVIMVATISAISWGIIYLFTEAITMIYVGSMGFSRTEASLPFLAIALGTLFTFLPRLLDMKAVRTRQAKGEQIQPEDKIIGFAIAAPALAIGLAWFAWTVPPFASPASVHWLAPTAALVPVGFAVNELALVLSAYLSDSYLLYSASAFAGVAFARAVASGLMPLLARVLYARLDANAAGSVLAGAAGGFCAVPWVLFRWSGALRERSPFARVSLEAHRRTGVEVD